MHICDQIWLASSQIILLLIIEDMEDGVCRIKKLHEGSACACKEVNEVNKDAWVLRVCHGDYLHACRHWKIINVQACLTS